MERVGAFICTGCDIGEAINMENFDEVSSEAGACNYITHPCLCSKEGVSAINKALEDENLDGIVIAACSQRVKQAEFRFDQTKYATYRVPLREQAVWPMKPGDEDTQMLAEDLLRMGIVRVSKMKLPEPSQEEIDKTILVVGGGMTGLEASRACANMGYNVLLVEKEDKLGGYMNNVRDLTPEEPPYNSLHANNVGEIIKDVESNSLIKVFTGSNTSKISGQPGQFDVEIKTSSGTESLRAGAIIQATGARPYDASKLEHLGYGKSPNVITASDVDKMIKDKSLARPSDSKMPSSMLFVQCAGSRDENHLPYCSSECCATTLRQVMAISQDFPDVQCSVVYRDMRAPGQLEHFYLATQEKSGAMFTRGTVDGVEGNGSGSLKVKISDSLLGENVDIEADMVVLATGMVPNAADGEAIRKAKDAKVAIEKNESEAQVNDAKKILEEFGHHEGTEILNLTYRQGPDMPSLKYSFPDSHYICFPYETRRTGIYAAGTMHAPMTTAQAVEDAWGAAMKAVQCVEAISRSEAVHPRAGDISIADFFMQRCTKCKRCTEECPFGSLNEDKDGTPEYNPLRCRKCGICLGACPERIISFPDYSVDAVASMIKAIEVPEEDEEKPRMFAIVCENDALPAIDEAAQHGMKWNPWIRIIPIRCLGATNIVWIADAMSRGVDGVLLLGCKSGDDYQCHYIRGSELAGTRMANVKETLDRLTLESDRVKVVEIARDEWKKIPEIFEEFAETIEEVGPNPYKGF